jgi:hypothetical protein
MEAQGGRGFIAPTQSRPRRIETGSPGHSVHSQYTGPFQTLRSIQLVVSAKLLANFTEFFFVGFPSLCIRMSE